MSWVLLALRKSELKMTQSQYVARELQISRAQRKDARYYQLEQMFVRNDMRNQTNTLYNTYKTARDNCRGEIKKQRGIYNDQRTLELNLNSEKTKLELQKTMYQNKLNALSSSSSGTGTTPTTTGQLSQAELETLIRDLETKIADKTTEINTAIGKKETANNKITEEQEALADAKETYETESNEAKNLGEEDLESLETEANDVDTAHEEEKVQVETQLEAIKQELQTISQAISEYIQSETIKI